MPETPAQTEAINRITAAIQAASADYPSDDGNADGYITEWAVIAVVERITPTVTELDANPTEYFTLRSHGLTRHAHAGLHLEALRTIHGS